jgi:hypothetical protein
MAERVARPEPLAQIGSLSLRLPGKDASFGRRVTESALARVAARLPAGVRGEIGSLRLRVRAPGASEGELSQALAEALLRALSRQVR